MADDNKKTQQPVKEEKLKEATPAAEGTAVKLKEKMWIKGTGLSRHLPKDSIHEVNPIAGNKLISKGAATETTAPKPKAAEKKAAKKDDEDDE